MSTTPPSTQPRENFLVYGAPQFSEAEIAEVVATLRSGWVGTGPKVAKFEDRFKAYKDAETAVAVGSCTAALHLSLLGAGLRPGDEVITSALTFCATVNAIIHSGATPVLADVDPATMNICPHSVGQKITNRTRAILPVHFAGLPCEMNELTDLADRHSLRIIEDCAHATEATYHDKPVGTIGDFGCFSFYVTKNVVTAEGGMVTARHIDDARKIKRLALHGMNHDAWRRYSDEGFKHYQVTECGFKYNMTDIQAALGIHQLAAIDKNWLRRQEIWQQYNEALAGLPVTLPSAPEEHLRHAYHLYPILIDEEKTGISRDAFIAAMTQANIGVGVHYLSIPEHSYYHDTFGWNPEDYPAATKIGRQTVSLPLSPFLTSEDIADVIHAVTHLLDVS
jgi:dTDP-4-amino-4,6-dideoxygalactose transaminase